MAAMSSQVSVEGVGFRVQGVGFSLVQGLGFMVEGSAFATRHPRDSASATTTNQTLNPKPYYYPQTLNPKP
jgi:hypothetical protein